MLEHHLTTPSLPTRTVILGSAGFVGSTIRARVEAAGGDALALSSKDLDLLAPNAADRLAKELRSGDAVVFVSALAPCKDGATLLQNVSMANAVCTALAQTTPEHVVYISSDAVYHDDANPVTEASCADPGSMHGMMHRVRELMLTSSLQAPVCILRPSLLYGAADPHNGYGPNRYRRLAQKGETISLFGEGEEQRDHVAVGDVAELASLALQHRSEGILNVATGRSVSFREIAEKVVSLFDSPVRIEGTPRQNPITHRHFDATATYKAFPQFRYTDLDAGLRAAHDEALG